MQPLRTQVVPKKAGRGWTPTDAPPAPLQRETDPHEDPAAPGGGASKPVGGMETCPWEVRFLCPTEPFLL
jgi:hypothetical protein